MFYFYICVIFKLHIFTSPTTLISHENNPGELGAVVDQLNLFISESEVYVKTKSYDDINKDDMYSYTQTAVDETGKTRKIIFTSSKELKKGHYLKRFCCKIQK